MLESKETNPRLASSRAGMDKPTSRSRWARSFSACIVLLSLLLVLGAASAATGSQDNAGPEGTPAAASDKAPPTTPATVSNTNTTTSTIRVPVNVVEVPVTVLSKRGIPVIDLTKSDFKVYEDGKRQTIRYFTNQSMPPLRIGLLIDTSNSARFNLKFEKDAASEFTYTMLRGLDSRNEIFLEPFDATSSIAQDFTNNPDAINEKLRTLKAGGGKAVYDAVYNACKHLIMKAGPREQSRRVLILISDGIDVQSKHSFDEAVSMAHRAETAIYTIGDTPYGYANPGAKYLKRLADDTGGAAFFPESKTPGTGYLTGYLAHGQFDNVQQNKGLGAQTGIYTAQKMIALANSLDSIRRQLTNQYLIGYTPTDSKFDGTYRKIRVVADRKGLIVRYKPGYFATPGE